MTKLEDKDRFYQIDGEIVTLFAPQDLKNVRPYTYKKNGWGKVERVEVKTDGTPTDQTAPRKKGRSRAGVSEIKTGTCWSFAANDGKLLLPWAGSFGLFKQAWRRTLDAKGGLEYVNAKLDLIKVYPRLLPVNGPIDTMINGGEPEVVLTPRNSARSGSIRVEEFFDYIQHRPIKFFIEVDSESPINEEKLVGMLKSFNTLDSFGPSKRGEMRIDNINQIKFSEEEQKTLLTSNTSLQESTQSKFKQPRKQKPTPSSD